MPQEAGSLLPRKENSTEFQLKPGLGRAQSGPPWVLGEQTSRSSLAHMLSLFLSLKLLKILKEAK